MLAVAVLLLMVMFAARSGPERIFAGPLHDPNIRPAHPSYSFSSPPLPKIGPGRGEFLPHNAFFTALGWLLRVAFLMCVLWLLYRAFLYVAERLREYRGRPVREAQGAADFDVLDDPQPLVEEMRKDADEQFELLMGGTPRNAIVACWDRFEEQAERVNASRKDWETSSEFTLRLLEAVSADEAAVSRLELLYREARFSDHEVGEADRQAAVEALRAIHASLGIGARTG